MKGAVLDVRNLTEEYKEVLLCAVIDSFKRRNLDYISNNMRLVRDAGWWYFSLHRNFDDSQTSAVIVGWDPAGTPPDPEYTLINLEDFQ